MRDEGLRKLRGVLKWTFVTGGRILEVCMRVEWLDVVTGRYKGKAEV